MKTYRHSPAALVAALILSAAARGAAETTFAQKAAAEAAFQEGTRLFTEGRFDEACATFEASQHLEPALGTMLRLADCYDKQGKTASAWAAFAEAAAAAAAQGRQDREQIARDRVDELSTRLSYLTVQVSAEAKAIAGIELTLDDAQMPSATWGTPIPVNPGIRNLSVSAPGHETWTSKIEIVVTPGKRAFEVPALVPSPVPKVAPTQQPSLVVGPAAAEALPGEPELSVRRIFTYIAGGVGIVALGAGGYFVYRAVDLNRQSLANCLANESNACSPRGKALRDDAQLSGNVATGALGAGLGLVGLSAVLLLTDDSSDKNQAATALRVNAQIGTRGAQFSLTGVW